MISLPANCYGCEFNKEMICKKLHSLQITLKTKNNKTTIDIQPLNISGVCPDYNQLGIDQ